MKIKLNIYKRAAIYLFDPNLQDAIIFACANRIGPTQLLAIEITTKGKVLALHKIERFGRIGRKRQHHRITDCFVDVGHSKRMKLRH